MKLYCNGFNLFRQFNVNKPILDQFSQVFEFEVIKQAWINQSYSIIQTDQDYLLCHQNKILNLNSILGHRIGLLTSNDDQITFVNIHGKLLQWSLNNVSDIHIKDMCHELGSLGSSVVNINSGSKLTISYLSDGSVYNGSRKLVFNSNALIDIKCGKDHCLLLDKNGNVYSFGAGSRGQLGHGKLDDELEPQLIESLAGIKIKNIAVGGWHSCALSQDGDLYVWGWNSNGQLGLGKSDNEEGFRSVMASPTLVDFDDENLSALFIACGSRHLIAFLENNQLYGCGWNKYRQLTPSSKENYFKITHLHDFKNEDVVGLHCGPWNSAVLCK